MFLYNKDLQKRSNHTTAFGFTVSLFFLIALAIASIAMMFLGRFGGGFSYKRFAIYIVGVEFVIVITNNYYAKKKLGKPIFSFQGWKDLGADIKKRAHENLEKQNKLDL